MSIDERLERISQDVQFLLAVQDPLDDHEQRLDDFER